MIKTPKRRHIICDQTVNVCDYSDVLRVHWWGKTRQIIINSYQWSYCRFVPSYATETIILRAYKLHLCKCTAHVFWSIRPQIRNRKILLIIHAKTSRLIAGSKAAPYWRQSRRKRPQIVAVFGDNLWPFRRLCGQCEHAFKGLRCLSVNTDGSVGTRGHLVKHDVIRRPRAASRCQALTGALKAAFSNRSHANTVMYRVGQKFTVLKATYSGLQVSKWRWQ